MAILPEELIVEILLLLPIASLVRLRCVSKKWRDLIDSPNFAISHLDRSKKPRSMMICLALGDPNSYHIDLDSICNSTAPDTLLKPKELTNPCLGRVNKYYGVVGLCNGLLCIATDDDGIFCLWNPSTRKHSHIPKVPLKQPDVYYFCSFSFGYDCNSDDYKVVGITQPTSWLPISVVWIYSLKSGSWKSIGDFPYCFQMGYEQSGAFVKGALHWVARHSSEPDGSYMIVVFDLRQLEFSVLPLPEYIDEKLKLRNFLGVRVGVLDGCLYATLRDCFCPYGFQLWVMKESWTRLTPCLGNTLTPLAYTESGDLLLWTSAGYSRPDILRYEFETGSFNRMESLKEEFSPSSELHCLRVYIPSLVCPQSAGNSIAAL